MIIECSYWFVTYRADGRSQKQRAKFQIVKSILRRQRLRHIIGHNGSAVARETERLRKAIALSHARERVRMASLLTPRNSNVNSSKSGQPEDDGAVTDVTDEGTGELHSMC